MANQAQLVDRIRKLNAERGRIVIGISGFCGSGKSTLARELASQSPDWVRLRGDDFLDPQRSHRRSSDWDGVARERLAEDVIRPFESHREVRFQRYDWTQSRLGPFTVLPPCEVLIIDLIGLFHPDCLEIIDLSIWVDVDLQRAVAQGKARDKDLGRDHDQLWDRVWAPNEIDFAERFDPRSSADELYDWVANVRSDAT
ncbi:uridine kinase [Leifsonia sp. YAF41]|uniref:uridine kinase family protein n=1 Tax=Leifsonia sp. YAF41 TaxID=3233086 RepID=UPI003F9DEC2F